MQPIYIIIPSVILLAFLFWKEAVRKNKRHLVLRLSASALAVISLIFIAIPVTFQQKLDPANENTAVLLTDGFDKDSLARLKNIPVFTNDLSVADKYRSAKYIPDLAGFVYKNKSFTRFHILGYGLQQWELVAIQKYKLIFHPSAIPEGFVSVQWPGKLRSGETLRIQGTFNNTSFKTVKLVLKGLGTSLDSINLAAKKTVPFELSTIPNHLDKAVYSLITLSGKDTISEEKIPLLVEEPMPLRILILSSSPDFENKFLKNWLFEKKYALAVRTAISRDKFNTEFLNIRKSNLNRISLSLLENFDLLIGDMTELSRLNQAETRAVQNQVGAGMGLIIKAEGETGSSGFFRKIFRTREIIRGDQKSISLNWEGHTAKKTRLPSPMNVEIVPQPGNQVLVRDMSGKVLVNSKLYGKGRIVLNTVSDTYTWMLANNLKDFSLYWSYILEKAARKTELTESWIFRNAYPAVNQEIALQLEVLTDTIPDVLSEGSTLKFSRDPVLDFQWNASYWPVKSGWHMLKHRSRDPNWWYVYDKTDWKSIHAGMKIKNTKKFIEQAASDTIGAKTLSRFYTGKLPPIYFFILFIICCTYLWLEEKML